MVALGRRNVAIAVSLLLVLLFSSACAGAIGPAGPVGSSGAAGGTGSPGAIGPVGQGVAGLVVLPAAQPQSHPKAKNEARAFVTLSGWGFQPGEHWMAFMELNEGAMELNTEGPTMLTNGHADERGVVYAEPWKRSKPRGLVPYSLKPGNYLVTMEGTEGTTAYATHTILEPLAPPKPSAGPGVGLVVLPAAQPQSHPKAKNEARAFVTLSAWGFQPGEHWMAFMELNEGAMELNTEGPTMLTNGHADERGVVYAEPWKRSKPRGLVPYSLKPGNYLVTMEGTEGTTAHATLTVLDPLPTE